MEEGLQDRIGIPGWLWALSGTSGHVMNVLLKHGPLFMVSPTYVGLIHDYLMQRSPVLASKVLTYDALSHFFNWGFMMFFLLLVFVALRALWSTALTVMAAVGLTSLVWIFVFLVSGVGGVAALALLCAYGVLRGG